MKIGVIGAGTMGQGIAKAFAQVEGNTVALWVSVIVLPAEREAMQSTF